MSDDQSKNHTVLPFNHCSSIIDLCLRSIHETDAMNDCAPMRNENRTQTHLMHTDFRRLF